MKLVVYLLPILLLLHWQCRDTDARPESRLFTPQSEELSETVYVLVFKTDKVLELWASAKNGRPTRLRAYPLKADANTPIGVFELPTTFDEQGYEIPFPNDFYRQKRMNFLPQQPILLTSQEGVSGFTIQLTETDWVSLASQLATFQQIHVLIFPNDARKSGILNPCMQCPYWMAEIYSQLHVYLQRFSDEPTF